MAENLVQSTVTRYNNSNPGVYFVNFKFLAVEEFAYDVKIHVLDATMQNSTMQNLTSVGYVYAMHPPLEDSCASDPSGADCGFALNASACKELQCLNFYRNDGSEALDMPIDDWRKRCVYAGCLYRAGYETNRLNYVVEEGYWHRFNGYRDHWVPKQQNPIIDAKLTQSDEKSMIVETIIRKVEVVCNATQPTVNAFSNSSCRDDQIVWWRPCDNFTLLGDPTQWPDVAKQWPEVQGACQNHDDCNSPFTATRHVVSPLNRFETDFQVRLPGTYLLTTQLTVQGDEDSRGALALPPVEVVVSPGQLNIARSRLQQPVKTPSAVLYPDPGDKNTEDPLKQNPKAGPGVGTKNILSSISFDYTLDMKDDLDNTRDGTDQMLVQISMVPAHDATRLDASAGVQPTKQPPTKCFATNSMKEALDNHGRSGAAANCRGTIGLIEVGDACDVEQAGHYTFSNQLEDVYGVFMLDVWLCPSFTWDIPVGTNLMDSLQDCLTMRPEGQRMSDTCAQPPCRMGQPQYDGLQPGNPLAVLAKPMPMVFTICPPNSDTSTGRWADTGFVDGPELHQCSCRPGYNGRKGLQCSACQHGKYTSTQGSPICSDCAVGKHCSCQTSGACIEGGDLPACNHCNKCQAGQYQPSQGQSQCILCPKGFDCGEKAGLTGMTFPVAYEGSYVDPTDPAKTHSCKLGLTNAQSSGGVTSYKAHESHYLLTNPPKLVVPPEDVSLQEWESADTDQRSTMSGRRGSSCPGGNLTLAKDLLCVLNDEKQLVSSVDATKTDQCRLAVGSLCLEGYSGPEGSGACTSCCKAGESGCERSWYRDTTDNQCYECPETNGAVIIGIVTIVGLVLAPFILKFAEAMKHAGALQAPVMSLINFFQSVRARTFLSPRFTHLSCLY